MYLQHCSPGRPSGGRTTTLSPRAPPARAQSVQCGHELVAGHGGLFGHRGLVGSRGLVGHGGRDPLIPRVTGGRGAGEGCCTGEHNDTYGGPRRLGLDP